MEQHSKSKKIAILYSGGFDSFFMGKLAANEYQDSEIIKLFYDIGQPYLKQELKRLPKDVIVRKIDWSDLSAGIDKNGSQNGNIFIPGRNAVLAVTALSQTLANEVWLGVVEGEDTDSSTDKNTKFRELANGLMEYVLSPFLEHCQVVFPLLERKQNKASMVATLLKNRWATEEEILATFSCHFPDSSELHCGTCNGCFRRFLAFEGNNIDTAHQWRVPPPKSSNWKIFWTELQKEKYKTRMGEYLPYLLKNI